MPPCNTYHLTWVSLTSDVGYLFMAAPANHRVLLLTMDEGYLLTATSPDLERGVAPLNPPVPAQELLLGGREAPLGRCSCTVTAWHSRLLPLTLGEG